MKKAYIYLTLAVAALLGAAACSKSGSDPIEDPASKDSKIGFGTVTAQRVGEVTADPAKKLQIQVYDYFTAAAEGSAEIEYIDELIQESATEGVWAFVKAGKKNSYSWKTGRHEFFGWVATDESGAAVPGLSYAEKVLTLAGTELPGTANTDYRYADIKTVDWTKALADTPVELTVKHLSSALTYKVTNNTGAEVTVNSVKISRVVTSASAKVDYTADTAAPEITLGAADGTVTLLADGKTCVWPQEVAGAQLTVDYTEGSSATPTELTVTIPDATWEAGKVYNIDIQVVAKTLEVTFTVAPWNATTFDLNTQTGSINMSNVTWTNTKVVVDGEVRNTVVNGSYAVYMYYKPEIPVDYYEKNVYGTYTEDVYQTYEEDIYDTDGETILHHKGDFVLDENNEKIKIHSAGDTNYDDIIHHAGDLKTSKEYTAFDYFPAQGFFTVNYPKSGLYKIGFIQARFWSEPVPEGIYEIYIYDNTQKPAVFRPMKEDGETITNDTVYFQVRATGNVPETHPEYRAQIDIWFKPEGGSEWISAYSEIRANYALTIPATN